MIRTIHFKFTKITVSKLWIIFRVAFSCKPFVVENDVSSIIRACCSKYFWYRVCSKICIFETQSPIFFFCSIGNMDRKSKESTSEFIGRTYKRSRNTLNYILFLFSRFVVVKIYMNPTQFHFFLFCSITSFLCDYANAGRAYSRTNVLKTSCISYDSG